MRLIDRVRGVAWRRLVPVVVGILGALVGILLTPPTTVDVGPVTATIHLRPSMDPRTVILLPPVGEVSFATHTAPVEIEATVQGVDIAAAENLLYSDEALRELERTAPEAITDGAVRNAGLNALAAMIGASVAVGLTYRHVRRAVVAGGSALAVTTVSCGLIAATFRPDSLRQPQFDGLLSQAAYVADIGHTTMADYGSYRSTLADFVGQVSALYIAADSLPSAGRSDADLVSVLHVSDIHDNPQSYDVIRQLTAQFDVSFIIDTGDIVSWGTPWEDAQLNVIGGLGVPYVFIAGNHDGQGAISTIAAQPNAVVLNNQVTTVDGLTIAGIGDPRFAADDDSDSGAAGRARGTAAVAATAGQLGDTVQAYDAEHPDAPVDIALIHDPTQPDGLLGRAPLVLSGHMHKNDVQLDRDGSGTDWFTVGSTGGALASGGVRPVADGGKPLDLDARLLHFDRATGELVAYDDITMGGLGLVSVSIQRHAMPDDDDPLVVPEDAESPVTEDPSRSPLPSISPGETVPDDERITDQPLVTSPPGDDASAGPATTDGDPAGQTPPTTAPTPTP